MIDWRPRRGENGAVASNGRTVAPGRITTLTHRAGASRLVGEAKHLCGDVAPWTCGLASAGANIPRMNQSSEQGSKPDAVFWGTVLISSAALYVLSYAPASWHFSDCLVKKVELPAWSTLYIPCGKLIVDGPDFASKPLVWYGSALIPDGGHFIVPYRLGHWRAYKKRKRPQREGATKYVAATP